MALLVAIPGLSTVRLYGQGVEGGAVADLIPFGLDSLAIDPITTDAAGLTDEGAEEVTVASTEALPVIPRALTFHAGIGAAYDDNVFLTQDNKEADTILLAALGFGWAPQTLKRGTLAFDYTATGFRYLQHTELNTSLNHAASLTATLPLKHTTFSLGARYQRLSGSDLTLSNPSRSSIQQVESAPGDRNISPFTQRDVIGVDVGAAIDLASKTSLNLAARYDGHFYDDDPQASTSLQSSTDLSGRAQLGYAFSGKTTLGMAGVFGRLEGDNGSIDGTGGISETYEQALLTIAYDATGKLKFSGSAGLDFRQGETTVPTFALVDDGLGLGGVISVPDGTTTETNARADFVFSLGGHYQWRDKTGFSLTASRATQGSATVAGSAIDRTSVYLGLEQKIADRWNASVIGGYDFSAYQDESTGAATSREESFWTARFSLNFVPTARTSVGVFYELRKNDSTAEGVSYQTSRVGLQLGVAF